MSYKIITDSCANLTDEQIDIFDRYQTLLSIARKEKVVAEGTFFDLHCFGWNLRQGGSQELTVFFCADRYTGSVTDGCMEVVL